MPSEKRGQDFLRRADSFRVDSEWDSSVFTMLLLMITALQLEQADHRARTGGERTTTIETLH